MPALPLRRTRGLGWARASCIEAITGDQRDPAVLEAYPFEEVGARATWPWTGVARTLVRQLAGRCHQEEARTDARRDHRHTRRVSGRRDPGGRRSDLQTIAHDFINAEHAGAVLDLEVPGFHYNRINNPTNDVLEKRIAALEGGTAALVIASGMAAVSDAILTVALAGSNFVVAPQLYGATFTYFAHVLPTLGIEARFAADDQAAGDRRR